jgi:heat shock protein HtpX
MWELIRANQRRSAVLITTMALVLIALGVTGGMLLTGGGEGIVVGLILALIIWGIMMMVYFTAGESILLNSVNAKQIQKADFPRLFNIVEEMSIASGLGYMPRVFVIDDPAPNAFAVGRKPETSAVAVTTGLLQRLNRDELQGVIAHEVAHLKNQDVKFMTLAAVLLGAIVILSEVIRRALWFGARGRSRSRSRGGGQAELIILLVGLLFAILAPLMAQLLYFACSRKREYLADACGAQYTRFPEGLASALEKISGARIAPQFATRATAPMFIVPPLAAHAEASSLFSTHPPTAERIRILRAMGNSSLAAYEAAFRQTKHGALFSDHSLRNAPVQPIRAASNEGPLLSRHEVHNLSYSANRYQSVECDCGLQMRLPPGYELDTVRCVRCGSVLPLS